MLPPNSDYIQYGNDFDDLCNELGFAVNAKKNTAGTSADFLGIELDSIAMEARLPPAKLKRAQEGVKAIFGKDSTPYIELKSLAGFLSFAARVIIPGRAFLRRIFDALREKKSWVRINRSIRSNLTWWSRFLAEWNGIRLLQQLSTRLIFHIWTDASGGIGLGGFIIDDPPILANIKEAFSIPLPTRWKGKDI